MSNYLYENHLHKDLKFPIIFHLDLLDENRPSYFMHYHEGLEILYFIEGEALVYCNKKKLKINSPSIVIINSKELHSIEKLSPLCKYYCLIIDKDFICHNLQDFFPCKIENIIKDKFLEDKLLEIVLEFKNKNKYFKEAIKGNIILFLIYINREHKKASLNSPIFKESNKIIMVKEIISFLKENYKRDISLEEISLQVSFSKYYVCRSFKEVTGKTILDYTNHIRCIEARNLMLYEGYNISESAYKSGFNSLSYFSKIYKKHLGKLPSEEKFT